MSSFSRSSGSQPGTLIERISWLCGTCSSRTPGLEQGRKFRSTSTVSDRVTLGANQGRRKGRRSQVFVVKAFTELAAESLTSVQALQSSNGIVQLYRSPGLPQTKTSSLRQQVNGSIFEGAIEDIRTERCFNIALSEPLTLGEAEVLIWLLSETFEPEQLGRNSFLTAERSGDAIVEVGPRLSFSTAWAANAQSICQSCGLGKVTRIECSRRYLLCSSKPLPDQLLQKFASKVHDRMTEEVYKAPLSSFKTVVIPAPVYTVPLLKEGRPALEAINEELGLGFDEWDKDYYLHMFTEDMKRDPTSVELFDMAQSNSEHSRHWFFGAKLVVDGKPVPESLMSLVKDTLRANPTNSVIGFKDNSSAIRGGSARPLLPQNPGEVSPLEPKICDWDILLTAETHNFPCAVAPYPGAETGAGGRIRDTHATGTGSIMGVATAGYCVGNLQLPGSSPEAAPWENPDFEYPDTLASPLQILIDASNGASDYGNKFGEPLLAGFTRSFGLRLFNDERREWLKPIMFSGGLGQIDHRHLEKKDPEVGMLIVKIGGPAYRIGMGGGAASSVASGSNKADLDFNAVQRGDAEMAQKLWRVVRACVDLGSENPIQQIHDQGAGGNCNVVKEIIYPLGATIDVRELKLGDETMSVLEIWGAEYQENDALLIRPQCRALLEAICARERCLLQIIGSISGSGKITLKDRTASPGAQAAVDLDLDKVLGKMPRKTFEFQRRRERLAPLALPSAAAQSPHALLDGVLRLPAVASKRFLTTKVDRSVTGLVAQQQCVGPLHLPVADVAVMAQSHLGLTGAATAIGEQPYKGFIDPAAMARLALGEALTNLLWAAATSLSDVKASVNWMYAAKMDSEGAAMYDAAKALKEAMLQLQVACDGGKDSLSMAATAGGEVVKAPGNLVISAYVTCPDVTLTVTPDLKLPETGRLLHVDLGRGRRRLGGSALAHSLSQVGDESPDVSPADLKAAWEVTQKLLRQRLISAGHDISDGGIAVTLLEMAFAGNLGLQVREVRGSAQVDLPAPSRAHRDHVAALFAEELGLVVEVDAKDEAQVLEAYSSAGLPVSSFGAVSSEREISITVNGQAGISGSTGDLWRAWEATGMQLERLQATEECVAEEAAGFHSPQAPQWVLPWRPQWTSEARLAAAAAKPKVAVIREEGSNGDREMAAALWAAGLEPWDVTMSDLLAARASLADFRGAVFVGGFSYADVLDSAKGWAGTIRHNSSLQRQFTAFYTREDTWSLGVCNGCQLMALLGWVPGTGPSPDGGCLPDRQQPRFIHNRSARFESRWATVAIRESPAIMLKGMEGAAVGIWCAHGEGRAHFPDPALLEWVESQKLAPIRYCDADQQATEAYPANPNGSPAGIAALCSPDGRHLAIMPHPERCFLMWQNPWFPVGLGLQKSGPGPWLRMFQNAREWCAQHPQQ